MSLEVTISDSLKSVFNNTEMVVTWTFDVVNCSNAFQYGPWSFLWRHVFEKHSAPAGNFFKNNNEHMNYCS